MPTRPRVLPSNSTPRNLARSHLPDRMDASPRGDVARHGQHQPEGVLRSRDAVGQRSIDHKDAPPGGLIEVDVVDPHSGPPHDPQTGGGIHEFAVDTGAAADHEPFRICEKLLQTVARFPRRLHNVTGLPQIVRATCRQHLGDYNYRPLVRSHGHDPLTDRQDCAPTAAC